MAEIVAGLNAVTKRFGATQALDGVSLQVRKGEILALLGPNGAGKTTAMEIMLGLRRPDSGKAELLGGDPRDPSRRLGVGVTPQDAAFPPRLSGREVIELVRAHYPSPRPTDELIVRFGLGDFVDRQSGGLSGGQRRRIALALAFAGGAGLVFLDEPTTGLDADIRREFWAFLAEFAKAGNTLLLTTHYLEEAEALASRIVLLRTGRIAMTGSVAEIRNRVRARQVTFRAAECPTLPAVLAAETNGDCHRIVASDADRLVRALVQSGVAFRDLEVEPMSLESALRTIGDDGEGASRCA
ncbi:ABC transporter ATP-binding protein [Oceanibacterium hippocampi]|uniref:Daunorubicin/doxorubicin resistance ATP-binding protein DrrA n=1 Tax=Oceanibacterium hippocampi TaxID=745714 RepID=A0A1Y5R7G6_9PROT|nr:ABC transporter ATP-binding protein [Oceanibacterium hippocampi]SLN10950.1 Daunorubicin/doxorubicin resistance ATP-binding protein DrrA [Oceanibacterium hippocampi]